jgi:hypothetical protein
MHSYSSTTYRERVYKGFTCKAWTEAILPVHVRMQLEPSGLPDHPVHVSGFGGQDLGVLDLDAMSLADAVFGCSRFVWMSQRNVPVMLLDPGINGTAQSNLDHIRRVCCTRLVSSVPGCPSRTEGSWLSSSEGGRGSCPTL